MASDAEIRNAGNDEKDRASVTKGRSWPLGWNRWGAALVASVVIGSALLVWRRFST